MGRANERPYYILVATIQRTTIIPKQDVYLIS